MRNVGALWLFASLACACEPVADCPRPASVRYDAEDVPQSSTIHVDVVREEERAVIHLTEPDSGALLVDIPFALGGAELDDVVTDADGNVAIEAGANLSEAPLLSYVRLVDERGLWFEGGTSTLFDERSGGGAQIDTVFSQAKTARGERCLGFPGERDVFDVDVAFDDGTRTASPTGSDGVLRGVTVRAFGVSAETGTFYESVGNSDTWERGFHDVREVFAYVFRTR